MKGLAARLVVNNPSASSDPYWPSRARIRNIDQCHDLNQDADEYRSVGQ